MKKNSLLTSALLLLGLGAAHAQLTNLYSWDTISSQPRGNVIISGNVMYGLTYNAGANHYGSVFSINKDGSNYKDIYSFADSGTVPFKCSGGWPEGSPLQVGNKLYGVTVNGGPNDYGQIFSVNIDGTGFKDLWDFADTGTILNNSNGASPEGTLTLVGGRVYGFTEQGGAYSVGQIFSIDTLGLHKFKDVYDFGGTSTEGANPRHGALASSANGKTLYGTTEANGTSNYGMIYSVDTDGTHFKCLLSFNNLNGRHSYGSVIRSGAKLFGMTQGGGGWGDGNVYTIDTAGNNYKDLADFTSANGYHPYGDVTLVGKKLYGMTYQGGIYNYGVIFMVDTTGNNFSDVVNFSGINGYEPYGSNLTYGGGDTLYGMTTYGGNQDNGTIFRFLDTNIDLAVNTVQAAAAGNIAIYPNPNNGQFTISIGHPELVSGSQTIEIYNSLGQLVYNETLNQVQSDNHINITNPCGGVYLYRIISAGGNLIGEGKLVIQK